MLQEFIVYMENHPDHPRIEYTSTPLIQRWSRIFTTNVCPGLVVGLNFLNTIFWGLMGFQQMLNGQPIKPKT